MSVTKLQVQEMFTATVKDAIAKGYENISQEGWALTFNKRKRALGICNYSNKEIQISLLFMKTLDYEEVLNTVRHEVSHALAGHAAGHGPRWRSIQRDLGGDTSRCTYLTDEQRPQHSWELVNTLDSSVVAKYHRKPRRNPATLQLRGAPETLGKLIVRRV